MSETWKKQTGWSDESGDDGLPKFGKKASAWFGRLLRTRLTTDDPQWVEFFGVRITAGELDAVVSWLAESPMKYVKWKDSDEYHGGGFANGGWVISWEAVRDALPDVLSRIRAAGQAARFPTLDEWLLADLRGSVKIETARGGAEKLPKRLRRELQQKARARRKGKPRTCCTCRGEFQPTCNRARRCKACIDAG